MTSRSVLIGIGVMATVATALVVVYRNIAYVDETNFLTLNSSDGISAFSVQESTGVTLWRIEAPSPQSISSIHYGEVPPGFLQAMPLPPNRPRQLRKGEQLKLRAETPTRFKEHTCDATDESSVLCGYYIQGPISARPGQ